MVRRSSTRKVFARAFPFELRKHIVRDYIIVTLELQYRSMSQYLSNCITIIMNCKIIYSVYIVFSTQFYTELQKTSNQAAN